MSTFVVIPISGNTAKIDGALGAYKNKALKLDRGEWLVSYDGTSKQLSDDLGISNDDTLSAIVIGFSAYWGRASADIWEWIKANGS